MKEKECKHCGEVKPVSEFYKRKACKDGYRPQCKPCYNEVRKVNDAKPEVRARINRENMEYHQRNREARCAAMAKRQKDNWGKVLEWREENKQAVLDNQKRSYYKHHESRKKRALIWAKNNPGKVRARNAKREKAIRCQTPPWADLKAIQKFYIYSAQITAETGIQHHVDHIIPLQGKLVSGLHVEGNLRVIPARANIQKSNSYTL